MSIPQIAVLPAGIEQLPILDNLLQLYMHDFSDFLPVEIGVDARFCYPSLPLYFADPGRFPFLIQQDGKLAGLTLVRKRERWEIAEFFILRSYRRHGAGTAAAHDIFQRFKGLWEVQVLETNPARHFWLRTIEQFTGRLIEPKRVETGDRWWHVFYFESAPSE